MARSSSTPSEVPPFDWRDRVLRLERIHPYALADHPLQHKTHPEFQQQVMRGVLTEVGIADVLRAYVSPSTGELRLIDGHMRKHLGTQPWPTLILDVDDDEAAYLLLTYDEITKLALRDLAKTTQLLHHVQSGEAAVQQMLSEMAQNHGLFPDATPTLDALENEYGEPDEHAFWKTILVKVPPEVYAQYVEVLAEQPGADDAEKFAALLRQVSA